ncbi:MAG: FKBP-type peptidyl-prolyl cis-trans isomerase [Prevotellaceae bacterium]|jgi:FKBP-type peptidyl-prolyl cis-trans isomerase|nr:FKBP-type peptidyl-prolyl cis-trans isomerase [Prevotellaceae bacterium]
MIKKAIFFISLFAAVVFMPSCERNDYQEWKMINEQWLAQWQEEIKTYNDTTQGNKYITTESGLIYKIIDEGDENQRLPIEYSSIKVTYTGQFIDGSAFDSLSDPSWLSMTSVVQGWVEGLKKLHTGGIIDLYIPYTLGYGEDGSGSIPPYSILIFNIHLYGSRY